MRDVGTCTRIMLVRVPVGICWYMYMVRVHVYVGTLKRISVRYFRDAYSFQCGMQLLMRGGKWFCYWWVG